MAQSGDGGRRVQCAQRVDCLDAVLGEQAGESCGGWLQGIFGQEFGS